MTKEELKKEILERKKDIRILEEKLNDIHESEKHCTDIYAIVYNREHIETEIVEDCDECGRTMYPVIVLTSVSVDKINVLKVGDSFRINGGKYNITERSKGLEAEMFGPNNVYFQHEKDANEEAERLNKIYKDHSIAHLECFKESVKTVDKFIKENY